MKAIIESYKKKENGIDFVLHTNINGIRVYEVERTTVDFPLKFGYVNFNEDPVVKGTRIFLKDIISISVQNAVLIDHLLSENDLKNECELNGLECKSLEC
jgi:hypothetical protein